MKGLFPQKEFQNFPQVGRLQYFLETGRNLQATPPFWT